MPFPAEQGGTNGRVCLSTDCLQIARWRFLSIAAAKRLATTWLEADEDGRAVTVNLQSQSNGSKENSHELYPSTCIRPNYGSMYKYLFLIVRIACVCASFLRIHLFNS